jgi:hypothetical protein
LKETRERIEEERRRGKMARERIEEKIFEVSASSCDEREKLWSRDIFREGRVKSEQW